MNSNNKYVLLRDLIALRLKPVFLLLIIFILIIFVNNNAQDAESNIDNTVLQKLKGEWINKRMIRKIKETKSIKGSTEYY